MNKNVIELISKILKFEVSCDSNRKNTPSWDSLKHLEIMFAVEDLKGVELNEQQMISLDSVQKISDFVND